MLDPKRTATEMVVFGDFQAAGRPFEDWRLRIIYKILELLCVRVVFCEAVLRSSNYEVSTSECRISVPFTI